MSGIAQWLAVPALVLMLAAWVGVQRAWRWVFDGEAPGEDALERGGCAGCSCAGGACQRASAGSASDGR